VDAAFASSYAGVIVGGKDQPLDELATLAVYVVARCIRCGGCTSGRSSAMEPGCSSSRGSIVSQRRRLIPYPHRRSRSNSLTGSVSPRVGY